MNENKKSKSVSNEIIGFTRRTYAIAFAVLLLACGLLLFLTETDILLLTVKLLVMTALYVSLYFLVSTFLTKKIKESFKPLDEHLRDSSKQNEHLSKQLADALERNGVVSRENEKKINDIDELLDGVLAATDHIERSELKLSDVYQKEKKLYSDIEDITDSIKKNKSRLYDSSNLLMRSIDTINKASEEVVDDFMLLADNYGVLKKMIDDSMELLELVFNELTAMQSQTSQINLYSMNTSIEYARSGARSINVSNALDEIKSMSAKINDKSDEIALYIIRSRNSAKLADDQAQFCSQQCELTSQSFNKIKEMLDDDAACTRDIIGKLENVLDSMSSFIGLSLEAESYNNSRQNLIKTIHAENEWIKDTMDDVKEHLEIEHNQEDSDYSGYMSEESENVLQKEENVKTNPDSFRINLNFGKKDNK